MTDLRRRQAIENAAHFNLIAKLAGIVVPDGRQLSEVVSSDFISNIACALTEGGIIEDYNADIACAALPAEGLAARLHEIADEFADAEWGDPETERDIREAAATISAPGGWQPIDNAPKNGTAVLGWQDNVQFVMAWSIQEHAWIVRSYGMWARNPDGGFARVWPTQWKPLDKPAAPHQEKAG